ncbi:ABC transporter permease/M1 family aminopeptidase [Chitinophaga eiseniae]|uniref:Aminopeptidase n=1 Tax=Chitinophaga eiseniae TaxID=634771 RepID=A0A847SQH5_9BACT|nr:M1 family aminopeptidase [Chitinophaga eiseniae]NLR79549.1 aminopeptidase [Chitinophaga eiseniae]
MKAILLFDIKRCTRGITVYLVAACLLALGIFTGSQFSMNAGEAIRLDSPYTIGFMTGMLSLAIIFIATILTSRLLFSESENHFEQILFTTPLHKSGFAAGRFLALWWLTFSSFLVLITGFAAGQQMRSGGAIQLIYYGYPTLIFGGINSLFICSCLSSLAWCTKNKLLTAIGGLLLYVLYMVILLYSNSPFMAQALPQSLLAQRISAIIDPFGLSAYFYVSSTFSVMQRNSLLVPLSGYFLLNRCVILAISLMLTWLSYKRAADTSWQPHRPKAVSHKRSPVIFRLPVTTVYRFPAQMKAIGSFIKTDLHHTFKSIPFAASAIILLFDMSMEMYAAIEKGIRIPQQYASAGLMATTISANFHLLGLLLLVYFVNTLYWKSATVKFAVIETTTAHAGIKQWAHWCSSVFLLLLYTALVIITGILFQYLYRYPYIDWRAYAGVIYFNTAPLALLAGFLLLINRITKRSYIALGISVAMALIVASPLSKKFIPIPLLRFFSGFNGVYSDFNGYGVYVSFFIQRLFFGVCIVGMLWIIYWFIINKSVKRIVVSVIFILAIISFISGRQFMRGYRPYNDLADVRYEKQYRKYQAIPQPTVTAVNTNINLYPDKMAYTITGNYIIRNLTSLPVHRVLINFDDALHLLKAGYTSPWETITIQQVVSEIMLQHPLQPNDSACITFEASYHWWPVNGHLPSNAIIENGSFMRISRYYPQIGYQPQREITDSALRQKYTLGAPTRLKALEAPRATERDFIQLDMVISTPKPQTAIGTGELAGQWQQGDRNFFHYRTSEPIPFRFAVSSAHYSRSSVVHNGVPINVYYHPRHAENVAHLINCAKLTLDYCQQQFGSYPFHSVTFAEVSSYTKGFAGTAYPATIFMTEDMLFHTNIQADQQQDVINEIAGHELSHLWWGNSQIAPDDREGAVMLTETLAMYTEMMLYKKMYGREKMLAKVRLHQQIYDAAKGFSDNPPLYKVTAGDTHISYSKGAVVMVKLSELIGESKVNEALRHFLREYKYPHPRPVSTDLVNEILKVSDVKHHPAIRELFMGT